MPPGPGILDTSVVLLAPRLRTTEALAAEPEISAVTLAELSVGPLVAEDETQRTLRQAEIHQAEAAFEPIPFALPRRVPSAVSRPHRAAPAEKCPPGASMR